MALFHSLRQKVILGYIVGVLMVMTAITVNWNNLSNVEGMVISGAKVSDLFDTALEIRRFEKNYFLYETEQDYRELLGYIQKAESLLRENRDEYELVAGGEAISGLGNKMAEYREVLRTVRFLDDSEGRELWEKKLRGLGREIVVSAEDISRTERQTMQKTLQVSRHVSLLSLTFLVTAGFIVGAIFYRMFIRPLGILEKHMKKIADGEFSLIPIESKDRELVSLNSAFNRMLMELEARQMHLVQSEKLASVGTLLFGVAHEINNPLSNISTSCQILKEEINDPDIEYKSELIRQIEEETDRARDIVRSLLDYSRSKEKEAVNLRQAVTGAIRFIKAEVPAKIEISVSIPEDIVLFADKQKVQQVILNLIKNSITAIPEEEGNISISARRNLREGTVEIRFSDTGVGMEPEVLSKIFDPFFTTKGTRSGYGLGLFIVHNIVEEHGGSINVESEPGRGTTFLIKMPEGGERNGE
ncbi:MAG: ATP-binding protein [Thermodesulfovibrionales bacterium]